jgi:flagellum-specific peptidoglycan hydrolase FlgJ
VTPEQFSALRRIAQAAVAAERETGCPAEISAAQCIVESAWLKVAPGNNAFGIKSRASADCQYCLTKEYVNGEWQKQKLAFAVYPDLAACFVAHAHLIQRGPYAYNLGNLWRRLVLPKEIENWSLTSVQQR